MLDCDLADTINWVNGLQEAGPGPASGAMFDGVTMPFRLASLRFNGGTPIETESTDIIVLVGPNNAGKSRTLQEIIQLLGHQPGQPVAPGSLVVLDDLEVDSSATPEEMGAWLTANRYSYLEPQYQRPHFRSVPGGDMPLEQAQAQWQTPRTMGPLAGHLIRTLWSGERLGYLGAPARPTIGQHPDHPVQLLVNDERRLDLFRRAFRSAFRQNVIVDAWGQNVQLRLSPALTQDDFAVTSTSGLPDAETVERLSALAPVESQSDGVRSFAGILLTLLTSPYPMILLDEPEAFLHPPQARLLGRYLGALRQEGQLVVATHSLDVLLGLLESGNKNVMVVRLTRHEGTTSALTLDAERVETLWRDPLLRFSRAFDGLFHEGVVVCEGDTDSQFYSAVALHVATATAAKKDDEEEDELGRALSSNPFDVMFTYAGGKHRMVLIAEALRAVNVPVRAIADFDVLNDKQVISRLVAGLGNEYTDAFEIDRSLIDAHLRGSEPRLTVEVLRAELDALLGSDEKAELSRSDLDELRRALQPASGWGAAKTSGGAAVPSGDATEALQRLLRGLADAGVHVVPTGAVESFVKSVGGKGPRWVVEVIERELIAEASEAQAFVAAALAALS